MLKSSCFLVLAGLTAAGCQRSSTASEPRLSAQTLRTSSLRFIQETRLVDSEDSVEGSSGGFNPSPWPAAGFWPATPMVLPAQAAAYINATYGASQGFTYQSFEFTTTGCNATDAFTRYFAAIETVRGTPLSSSERESIESTFAGIFSEDALGSVPQGACLFYDLIACIADFSVQNQTVFQEAAESGDFASVFAGAMSCIAEVAGLDPTDTTDPVDTFDPDSLFPDE
ncbi:hypothetical protein [Oligoflexus tunisiensis]|uniref:hypothetical protein n=1 Tax=Oligoflexus tunisiensis TaxID=708132 RepID=UPI00114CE3BE|nr:hypothetical protein [Oligoflexus tunisiensis]